MYAPISLAALAALVPFVAAHGHLDFIESGGKQYALTGPSWVYGGSGAVADASWRSGNQDNGFIPSDAATLASSSVSCHKLNGTDTTKGALPALGAPVPVTAGSKLTVTWDQWPDHPGPTLDYLAKCPGACNQLKNADSLEWFKIRESGLVGGTWEAAQLSKNGKKQSVTIPKNIANGEYVLRHEIIALHGAGSVGGAQLYPQCVDIAITGGGSLSPSGTTGNKLYTSDDPGILINIYNSLTSYDIPGPAFVSGIQNVAKRFSA
ncbi:putative glycosyl hydrolase family 61 protein 7 [Elsinoe fawcettii]|nr:putative glycosyl hydrolase family 61 protein 7 [Elsinoe fawcettii]